MANKHRKKLGELMEPVEKKMVDLTALRKKVMVSEEEIKTQATKLDRQITFYYEEVHQKLQHQRGELKRKLQELSAQKKQAISAQREQVEYAEVQLVSMEKLKDAVTKVSDQEVLFTKNQISKDMKRLYEYYRSLDINPVELAIEFIPVKEYKESFPKLSGIFDPDDPFPPNCEITGIPALPLVGNKVNFKIISRNYNNVPCSNSGSDIIAKVQSSKGHVAPVEVHGNKDGSYTASFVTKQVGEAKLSIIIEGQHIKGSPCNITMCQDYTVIQPSKIVNLDKHLGCPWAIAFGKPGMWALTDSTSHCVCIFEYGDQLVCKFGTKGMGNGQFSNPYGLAFDDDNKLYVSDCNNHRVQKFTAYGQYLLQFGCRGSKIGQLAYPYGITVHHDQLYVAEYNNHRISVFQLNGQFCCIIGSEHLHNPWDVTISGNGYLLVADYKKNYISSFTLDGVYMDRFDSGHLDSPVGLTTDINGFVLVTESAKNRVSVFDQRGVHVCSFGSNGSKIGQFSNPRGIFVDPSHSNIYIADYNNKRIQIFATGYN